MATHKDMKQLVAAITRGDGEDKKTFWTKIGVAFRNGDGSYNLRFGEVSRIVARAASRVSWDAVLDVARRWSESAIVQRLGYLLDLHGVELPAGVRDRLLGLVARGSKVHFGSRAEWGTTGHLVQPWGILENVPREQLLDRGRDQRRRRAFPKRTV